CDVSSAAGIARISLGLGVGGRASACLRFERRPDLAIYRGRQTLLRNAEVTASLGRGAGGVDGNRCRRSAGLQPGKDREWQGGFQSGLCGERTQDCELRGGAGGAGGG